MGTRVPRASGSEVINRDTVRSIFEHENGIFHRWSFGAIAELLDNAVDEIQHGATKVLIDIVPNPLDGSPSLLVQDDGGGMDPDFLWNCMHAAYPKSKSPNSIGQNGQGFKAGVSCLGVNVIVFTRCLNTRMPSQSIGLLSRDKTCREHIKGPMVHYKYDSMTGGTIRYACHPGQFSTNMSILLELSPYNSEEELLQNFNDIGPHGTKIMVFNLSRNNQGNLKLDFDTDKKDIIISHETMTTEDVCVKGENNLVYQYMRSFRAYVSILYLGLPKHFRIILRGEEVKHRNLESELKHSRCITHKLNGREDKVVMGFLDGAKDDVNDRFCIYHGQRLMMPFVPLCASLYKSWSVIGVLKANHLKPAKTKQDFVWSSEIQTMQNTITEMTKAFWKHLIETKIANVEPSCKLTLAPAGSHDATNSATSNATGTQSRIYSSAPAVPSEPNSEPNHGRMQINSSGSAPRSAPSFVSNHGGMKINSSALSHRSAPGSVPNHGGMQINSSAPAHHSAPSSVPNHERMQKNSSSLAHRSAPSYVPNHGRMQINSFATANRSAPSSVPNNGAIPSPEAPPPILRPALPVAARRERQMMLMAFVNSWYQSMISNPSTVHPTTTLPSGSNYVGTSSQGIMGPPAPRPPAFPMASMAAEKTRLTIPAMASSNSMNSNARPVFSAPSPDYQAQPFSHPNSSGVPPKGVMRAPAPHLDPSVMQMPLLRRVAACNVEVPAPSRALPSADMAASGDLPTKMECNSVVTHVHATCPVPDGVAPIAVGSAAGGRGAAPATSDAAPASSRTPTVAVRAAEAHLAESSAIKGGASSSHQGRELHGGSGSGSNQGKQRANPLPSQGKRPRVTVKIEGEME